MVVMVESIKEGWLHITCQPLEQVIHAAVQGVGVVVGVV